MLAKYAGEEAGSYWGTPALYLNTKEREQFKLTVRGGKIYDASRQLYDTRSAKTGVERDKAMFVMDHDGNIYASTSQVAGKLMHSSFLAGAPVAAAGEIEVHDGEVKVLTRQSGHYRPTEAQLNQVVQHLNAQGVSSFVIDQEVKDGVHQFPSHPFDA